MFGLDNVWLIINFLINFFQQPPFGETQSEEGAVGGTVPAEASTSAKPKYHDEPLSGTENSTKKAKTQEGATGGCEDSWGSMGGRG